MKLVRSLVLVAALLVVGSAAASAQQNLQFQSGGSVAYNGVYVGPYTAWVTSLPGQPVIDIFCVDYAHEVSVNQTWTANFTNLASGDLGLTRLGYGLSGSALAGVQARYQMTAWLASVQDGADQLVGRHRLRDLERDHAGHAGADRGLGALADAGRLGSNYGSVDLANWDVVTRRDGAGRSRGHAGVPDPGRDA